MKYLITILSCMIVLSILLIHFEYIDITHKSSSQYDVDRLPNGEFIMSKIPPGPIHLGILGENSTDKTKGMSFNKPVVTHLLEVLKEKNVQAIFDTGNIISGYGDESMFADRIKEFSQLYLSILGKVPFFPAMGVYELISSESAKTFKKVFELENVLVLNGNTVAYTVVIGSAFFVIIPSDQYNKENRKITSIFNSEVTNWLDHILKTTGRKFRYRFVIGHESAFPLEGITFGHSMNYPTNRDLFWKILKNNKVLAYFASDERHFDRSNHAGVWQIVSGGDTEETNENKNQYSFYHCILLVIPEDVTHPPYIEVLDEFGKSQDYVELTPHTSPIFEFHISYLKKFHENENPLLVRG